jgi:hypothetical protein
VAITPSATPAPGFKSVGSMSVAREGNTATLLTDGRVLIAGGASECTLSGGCKALASAELYDPSSGKFTPTGSMSTPRQHHTATRLSDGRVLIVGGGQNCSIGGCDSVASAELYDPATGKFGLTGSMKAAREDQGAALLSDGRVLIVGGSQGRYSTTLASAELYDPSTGKFSSTGSLGSARDGPNTIPLLDGTVLCVGGALTTVVGKVQSATAVPTAELYDPSTGKFSPTGSMGSPRRIGDTATLLKDGHVLVTGGRDSDANQDFASSELYDPSTGTFTPTGSMAQPRTDHTATLLSDGRVLIAGGTVGGLYTARAELYDPKTAQFTPTGSMAQPRTDHTATLLSNGGVLIAGGLGDQHAYLAAAEAYAP